LFLKYKAGPGNKLSFTVSWRHIKSEPTIRFFQVEGERGLETQGHATLSQPAFFFFFFALYPLPSLSHNPSRVLALRFSQTPPPSHSPHSFLFSLSTWATTRITSTWLISAPVVTKTLILPLCHFPLSFDFDFRHYCFRLLIIKVVLRFLFCLQLLMTRIELALLMLSRLFCNRLCISVLAFILLGSFYGSNMENMKKGYLMFLFLE